MKIFSNISVITIVIIGLVGCKTDSSKITRLVQVAHPISRDSCTGLGYGVKTACRLTADYNATLSECGKNGNAPAFVCSGILIRGTDSNLNRNYYSWNPSPKSVKSGGVSFSYLRKDSPFQRFAYGYVSGFIFHPQEYTPHPLDSNIEVLCSFPKDGGTDGRTDHGCGINLQNDARSLPCNKIGITTGQGWVNKYQNVVGINTCGFNVNEKSGLNTKQGFNATIEAMGLLRKLGMGGNANELRLATWRQNKTDIPIEAFFYLKGYNNGLLSAQKDQKEFYQQTGNKVPIISIVLPADYNAYQAQFLYQAWDQLIK